MGGTNVNGMEDGSVEVTSTEIVTEFATDSIQLTVSVTEITNVTQLFNISFFERCMRLFNKG